MNRLKLILAFATGYVLLAILGPAAVHVGAQGQSESGGIHVCEDSGGVMRMIAQDASCPNGQQSLILKVAGDTDIDSNKPTEENNGGSAQIDKAILDNLYRRLKGLEGMNCTMPGNSRVVEPFELKDQNGTRIFYVANHVLGLYNSGQAVARMVGTPEGSVFIAQSGGNSAAFGISDTFAGLRMRDNHQVRVELGRNPEYGNYSLKFRSVSGATVAGIGVSASDRGLAVISDRSGRPKATIGVADKGAGLVEVLGGKSLAQLTVGDQHGGGRLWIGNAGGVGMVEAGDAGGYGIVKAGPQGFEFIPTPGLALPGSVIVGQR